jgi:hypothetical protein
MEKRVRSPNYPAFGLPEAVQKVANIYKEMHTHSGPREVIVKGMGYNSINGASATAVSALQKYGLLEKSGEGLRVSERALRILHPHSEAERRAAIREAAFDPPLFAELAEKFPGRMPNEELLRNYLIRAGFAPAAVSHVILAYRETSLYAEEHSGSYTSGSMSAQEAVPMQLSVAETPIQLPSYSPAISVQATAKEREIIKYSFEGGGFLKIIIDDETDPVEAFDMALTLIELKRAEVKRRQDRELASAKNSPSKAEDEEDNNNA